MEETRQEPSPVSAPDQTLKLSSANNTKEQPTKKLTKKQKVLLIVVIVLTLIAIGITVWYFFLRPTDEPQNNQAGTNQDLTTISKIAMHGNELSDFDLKFLKLNNNSENIVYSPLSIKYALSMLADAAADESKVQITNILGEYQPKAYLNSANRSLANAMFVRTDSEFAEVLKDSYTDALKTKYNASVVFDSFESPSRANGWISDETLEVIDNLFNEENFNTEKDFALINALAIDMKWQNQLQCTLEVYFNGSDDERKCKNYSVNYSHEKYATFINAISKSEATGSLNFSKTSFNGRTDVDVAEIGASANRYNIIKELGEDYIRKTVLSEHEKWLQESAENREYEEEHPFSIDDYMKELASNYNRLDESTDFAFYNSDNERVFAKDLREYDGGTLQYVGIMPKTIELNKYIDDLTSEYASNLINNLKEASDINNYKEGAVTKVYAYIPFFKYNYSMENFKNNLAELGITDVFDRRTANLSNMIDFGKTQKNAWIMDALHKADIDFNNDGIRAVAVTAVVGGLGATGGGFDYEWEVPIEEIDLTFDKPFVYIIRDKDSGEVWFIGAVYNI